MFLDFVVDIAHSEHCFEWDKCDDCWEDQVVKNIYQPEPVDAEMVGRDSLQDDPLYAGYSVTDRKFQMLDMSESISDLDVWNFYKTQIVCKVCNLYYNSRLGYCYNC